MDEWHIGDPVDWGDGWMDAQNWGRGQDDDSEPNNAETDNQYCERDEYSNKVWDYFLDNKLDDALHYIGFGPKACKQLGQKSNYPRPHGKKWGS